jgi:hypothetical protein
VATPSIAALLEERRRRPDAVLEHLEPEADLVVGVANGEPVTVLDAIEDNADQLEDVRVHRMFPLRDRRYIEGELPSLRHVSP